MTSGPARTVVADGDLGELRRSLAGAVLVPEDSWYDSARRCWNTMIDRRPAVIARCLSAADIAIATAAAFRACTR